MAFLLSPTAITQLATYKQQTVRDLPAEQVMV
jgi:hypothetical protein